MLSLDHPSVREVIKIAEEIVNENKILNTRTIYKRAKRKLKLPRKGLLKIIQLLIDHKILVEGSKFTRKSVLNNPFRNRVFQVINKNLGVHFSELRKNFLSKKMGTGQLTWHLEMLMNFNYIKKINFKNYAIFVPIDIDDESGLLYFLLRDRTNKKILFLFIDDDCLQKDLIYTNLDEKRETIYYHLKELEKIGILLFSDDELICISVDTKEILTQII